MAVQKSKKSRSRSGMRRSQQHLKLPTLVEDPQTGELRLRHQMTSEKTYRDHVFAPQVISEEEEEE